VPNVETEKVKPFGQVDDPCLFLGEGQTAFSQPFRQDALHSLSIFSRLAKADKIIRIPHDCPFASELAPVVICDTDGLLHAVQGNVTNKGDTTPP